jgi:hypothetical protein
MDPPEFALAPVIPPVIAPMVQVYVLASLAVKTRLGEVPLQTLVVAVFVTAGPCTTVTVMVLVAPRQEPAVDVGVTIYCTVPSAVLLGFVNVWFIAAPELALAPVIAPVIVPIVQLKVLAALAVRLMFGLVPLHVFAVAALVMEGSGLTVTVMA